MDQEAEEMNLKNKPPSNIVHREGGMKRYRFQEWQSIHGPTIYEDEYGEWVKYEDIKPILEISKDFGFIHIGDGDELGIMANKLLKLMGEMVVGF